MSNKPQGKANASLISISMMLLCLSLLTIAWFIVGSFVSYTPAVDATAMQNIYISRILHYGSMIAVLNFLAFTALVFGHKSA
jgi:hypothetical protein